MTKKISAIIFVFVTSLFLGGCTVLGYSFNSPDFSKIPVVGSLFGNKDSSSENANLTYWSLFEPYSVYETSIIDYQNKNKNVKVSFEQRAVDNLDTYKDSLLEKLKNGETVPDIIRIHATWVSDFMPYIEPAPTNVITVDKFSSTFYKPASDVSVINGKIYAIPLQYDALALIYNKDIFSQKNVTPPATWTDLTTLASNLTVSQNNKIIVSGAALGSAENVAHFSDIIGLLINQSEISLPEDFESDQMKQIIDYYTNFVKSQKVWDREFAYSPLSFAQGKVAMMFAPSWQLLNILASNPNINIGVAPVPQAVGNGTLTTSSYPNFWVEVVNKKSKNKEAAWKFIAYLATPEQQQEVFNSAQLKRAFGEPYSDSTLQASLSSNPYLGPFYTHADNGRILKITDVSGNTPYVKVIKNVVEGVLNGQNIDELLSTAKQEYIRLEGKN